MTRGHHACTTKTCANPAIDARGLCIECSSPNFDAFAADPMGHGAGSTVPTEAQERVAAELRGFYVALLAKGFREDQAIDLLIGIAQDKAAGDEPRFTL